ncbi:hypothetical protein BBO99_00009353 [Phytophthora kernoviae]|uniref:Uncharacterized protein n=2 Tax=Phytophthora kernoviae TaxID=325452 RepID=A0A3R7JNR3_9STRA|nr:hypothetical protein G195_011474 [Phytophthora kernoviae 00238/432]RLN26459.1 hypothetical protein BBI17_009513 [Phytophthora kernoviae]RLN73557.1 hypothetical protein BBO99_00009353 [Phytophthora kernoviae]
MIMEYVYNTHTLRANVNVNNDGDNLSPEDEERAAAKLPGRFNKVLSAMPQTSNAINNIPAKMLNGLFTTMEKTKLTPMKLQKYFKITGSNGGRYTFFKKFEVFWNTKCSVAA